MRIKNKLESIKKINELNLNKLPEQLFTKKDLHKVKKFLDQYPAEYYAIRDRSKAGGIFKFKVPLEEIMKEIEEYELFTINVSSYNYRDNQLLIGEIEILSNGDVNAILSTNPSYAVRDALKDPTFNFSTNIFDKKLNEIPCFDIIYKYIVSNGLQDVIVEFILFDKNVGINDEKIIILELRTDY